MPTGTTTQRQVSPIPPGRYWLTVIGELNIRDFGDWVRDMAGAVRVTHVENDSDASPVSMFVIFEVPAGRAPFFDAQHFGFPNHAPRETVNHSSDVIRAPEPDGPSLPRFGDAFGGVAVLALLFLLLSSK